MFKALIKKTLTSKKSNEEGQGLVEYALILVLVAVVVIVVLLQLGPAIGNIFSEITDVFGGAAVADNGGDAPDDNPNCVFAHAGRWVVVGSGGRIPAGSLQYPTDECTGSNLGGIDFDSVKIAGGAGVAAARAACQSHFGKNLRYTGTATPESSSEIWGGTGFWYCTP